MIDWLIDSLADWLTGWLADRQAHMGSDKARQDEIVYYWQ